MVRRPGRGLSGRSLTGSRSPASSSARRLAFPVIVARRGIPIRADIPRDSSSASGSMALRTGIASGIIIVSATTSSAVRPGLIPVRDAIRACGCVSEGIDPVSDCGDHILVRAGLLQGEVEHVIVRARIRTIHIVSPYRGSVGSEGIDEAFIGRCGPLVSGDHQIIAGISIHISDYQLVDSSRDSESLERCSGLDSYVWLQENDVSVSS